MDKSGKVAKNCGQIAKDYLLSREKNGFLFTFAGKDESKEVIRRKLKRVADTAVPCDVSARKVKKMLTDELESGKVSIGHSINPKKYLKFTIKKGIISTTEFTVGRKHTLYEIREKLFKKHKTFMRLHTDLYYDNLSANKIEEGLSFLGELDEKMNIDDMKMMLKDFERSRNIQIWHDASTVANHSHVIFSANILYDAAVFYTNDEYQKKFGKNIDIQSEVESPELYIIGRCKSTDEQIAYIETREACLKELNKVTVTDENIIFKDTMRLFHGDGPAVQLESGNQKAGQYFCPSCDVHLYQTDDISYSYQLKLRSLADIQHKIIFGKYGKKYSMEGKVKPLAQLSCEEIKEELISRHILTKETTKINLEKILKKDLKGCIRVPILLKNKPLSNLSSLNLEKYEIALMEPMHDIGGHINNIFEELPYHLSKQDQKKFNDSWMMSYKQKEMQRNCDRRKSLLTIVVNLDGEIDHKAICLLKSLVEIQRILYLGEEGRTSREILRLHNSCFTHFVQLKEVIGFHLPKLTREKLYGKYMHNLLVHSPIQYRLINGQSVNCEGEERFFNTIKQITRSTSSYNRKHNY